MKKKAVKALMIRGSAQDACFIKEICSRINNPPINLKHLKKLREGFAHLHKNDIDTVLLDLSLPSDRNLYVFKKFRRQSPNVPIVVLSGSDDGALALEVVRQGAQDCLVKDRLTSEILSRVMRHAVERKDAEEALRHQAEFERLITAISTDFINLRSENVDREIEKALKYIGEFLNIDRAYIFLSHNNNTRTTNTHEWHKKGAVSQKDKFQDIPVDSFPWFSKKLLNEEIINLSRVTDLPKRASAEKKELKMSKTVSFLAVPMVCGGNVIGFIGFDTGREERIWPEDTISLLKIAGNIFANALDKKETEEGLINLNKVFLSFRSDPIENINRIVALCGRFFKGDCAVYNRLEKNMLRAVGQWNTPKDFVSIDNAKGHICYDVVRENKGQAVIIRNLSKTKYAKTDPAVKKYKLETYFGQPIKFGKTFIGTLCVAFKNDFLPKDKDKRIISVLSSAIAVEEERRCSQEALRESQNMLQLVMNNIPQHIFWKDTNSVYLGCNENFARAAGVKSAKEIVGKTDYDLAWKKEEADFFRECDRRVMNNNAPEYHIIEPSLQADGKQAWLDTNKTPLCDKDGKVIGILGTYEDITERKQAQEALSESEEKYRLLADHIPLHLGAIDQNGTFIVWNKYSEKIFGYTSKEAIGNLTPADLHVSKKEAKKVIRVAAQKGIFDEETSFRRKDGTMFTARLIVVPRRDKNRKITGFYGFTEDVTERKGAEDALRKSEKLLRTVFDAMPHWVFVKDRNSKILLVNKKMADDYGVTPEDFINLPTRKSPAGKHEEKSFYTYVDQQVITKGERVDIPEEIHVDPDGKARYLHTIKVPLGDTQGNIIGLVGIAQDITDRKKQQTELDNYRQHLEELVDESTRELRQSERLAATGRLAASMAHEINNPLQGITTHLEIVREALPKNFKKFKNYELTINNIDKIRNIVAKLLDMYKITDSRQTKVDINAVIKKVISLVEHQLKLKKIQLQLNLNPKLPSVRGWRQQLHQVFLNLILNAQDSIEGRGRITITTKNDYNSVYVRIEDTGEGIAKEHITDIFDPFFTTKKESGTGLGLFISQGIVKEHKGDIKVKSELGKGTTFTVILSLQASGTEPKN